jgi:hypothetical protein
MSMIITTQVSDSIDGPWIFDNEPGFHLSTSGMTAKDILVAAGVTTEDESISDRLWPIDEITPELDKRLQDHDPEDDYLYPRLQQLKDIITAGRARGAEYLVAC